MSIMIPDLDSRNHWRDHHLNYWSVALSETVRYSYRSCSQTPFSPHSHIHTVFYYHTNKICPQHRTCNGNTRKSFFYFFYRLININCTQTRTSSWHLTTYTLQVKYCCFPNLKKLMEKSTK